MQASIEGEDDEGCGLEVVDNNNIEHWIEIKYNSKDISYHEQEGYSDKAARRTEDENEHVNQARRFAKFYVYRERGYDTIDHTKNPDYVNAVREAIAALSDDEFQQYFGALYQQLQSHHNSSTDRLVDIPAGARADDAIVYELDVYLGVDVEDESIVDQVKALAEAHGLDFEDGMQTVTDATESDLADWDAVGDHLLDITDGDVPLAINSVSGIHVGYPSAAGEHEVQEAEDPLDREADARIELLPADPGSLDEFRAWLDHHLRSQVRDCFAGMGLMPPEPFQTVGFGKFIYARRYDHYDLYPRFHMADDDSNLLFG
ncbi:hypothetical protein [Halomicrobium katesii]|uniref:hypothetical protein n=1 Tax=Halomicrobium katesii TaxID=437163 RepID=UPI00047822F3|nr:hypothetical protein [Halomicrobium katesii]